MMTEYYCALRPGSEIRLMRAEEVDLGAGVIRIPPDRAKSRRKEIVTMPEQLMVLYKDYLGDTEGNMFVFGKGGMPGKVPWSENTLRNQFNKYRDNLKMPKTYKLYSSKHTGITRLAESGMPLHIIMEHARHTNLGVTQAYIKRHGGLVDDRIRYSFPNP
jgi:integrase